MNNLVVYITNMQDKKEPPSFDATNDPYKGGQLRIFPTDIPTVPIPMPPGTVSEPTVNR